MSSLPAQILLSNVLNCNKEVLLSNSSNKQAFIKLLANSLATDEHNVQHCRDDADITIVLQTLLLANSVHTVLVGDDTDLLVLLLHYVDDKNRLEVCSYFECLHLLPSTSNML